MKHSFRSLMVRLIAILVIVCLVSSIASASSQTVDIVNTKMLALESMVLDGSIYVWDLSAKMAMIELLKSWRVTLDPQKVGELESESLTEEERERIANEIMWECFGTRTLQYLKEQRRPTDVFDEWSNPDFFIIYETLWHMIEPDAEREVIQTHFDEWLNQLREKMRMAAVQATPIPSQLTDAQKYEAVLLQVDRYMADVMSMSKRERDAATVTATCDGSTKAWQVTICIKGENLRQATKEWFLWSKWDDTKEYRAETDEYMHYYNFLPEWTTAETNTLEKIEYQEFISNAVCPVQLNGDAAVGVEVVPVQETVILEYTDGYMADVLSMNKQERSASVVMLEYDDKYHLWQVIIAVSGSDLSDETKYQLCWDYCEKPEYHMESDTYFHYLLYDANGRFVEGSTIEGYEFSQLVPREAYPAMSEKYAGYEYFDPYKCFLYAPAAEKAKFSQTYKPVINEWLKQHPQYATWVSSQNHYLVLITRNSYGTPPPNMLQENKALEIAYDYCISHNTGITLDVLMNRYHQIVYYDVTDMGNPVWKINLITDVERMISGDAYRNLYVVIDVWSGRVIRDQKTTNESDVEFHHGRW